MTFFSFDWGYTKSIVLGNHLNSEKDPFEIEVGIENYITNEEYNDYGYSNDIMLIKLAEEVELNDGVSPVCLPQGTDYTPGIHCYTTGWGNTECKYSVKGNYHQSCEETDAI